MVEGRERGGVRVPLCGGLTFRSERYKEEDKIVWPRFLEISSKVCS